MAGAAEILQEGGPEVELSLELEKERRRTEEALKLAANDHPNIALGEVSGNANPATEVTSEAVSTEEKKPKLTWEEKLAKVRREQPLPQGGGHEGRLRNEFAATFRFRS